MKKKWLFLNEFVLFWLFLFHFKRFFWRGHLYFFHEQLHFIRVPLHFFANYQLDIRFHLKCFDFGFKCYCLFNSHATTLLQFQNRPHKKLSNYVLTRTDMPKAANSMRNLVTKWSMLIRDWMRKQHKSDTCFLLYFVCTNTIKSNGNSISISISTSVVRSQ